MCSYTIDELNVLRNTSDGMDLHIHEDDLLRAVHETIVRIHTGDENEVMLLIFENNQQAAFQRLYRFIQVLCNVVARSVYATTLSTSVSMQEVALTNELNEIVTFHIGIAKGSWIGVHASTGKAAIAA